MATAVISLIIADIAVLAIVSYRNKLRNGCCGGGDAESFVKAEDKDISHYPHKAEVAVGGMTCRNCAARVESEFNKQDGFFAKVNLKSKTAAVYSKNDIDPEDLRVTVIRAGYTYNGSEIIN